MKRKLLLLAILCFVGVTQAQETEGVSIGVPLPDASAILHVQSDNKGMLIPNVVLIDLNSKSPIKTNIKESLLVYNKTEKKDATSGKVEIAKGYHYWVATSIDSGRWVRVLTSEDGSEILAGQIQESFVEEKVDDGTGTMVGSGVFVYNPDKTKVAEPDANVPDRLKLDIPELVKKNQTVTKFELKQTTFYKYSDGSTTRDVKLTDEEMVAKGIVYSGESKELELVYTDEKDIPHIFLVKDLLGANVEDVPAITALKLNAAETGLVFTNDKGKDSEVLLIDLVKKNESLTSLEVDNFDNLIFVDEKKSRQQINLRKVVKEPWYVAETNEEATKNTQNIFINGWVGVGLKAADATTAINNLKSDEKLRVEGSIYARNSYYADYVFDNYFTKEASALKYDYNFKDLATVESFIKANYHLPGITPITQLDKTVEEGYLINVSELSVQLLEKVEELYLHTIEQQKIIEQQKKELNKQEERLQQIENMLNISKK